MFRNFSLVVVLAAAVAVAPAQQRRSRIQVDHYTINAEVQPSTQSLSAAVTVRFTPLDDGVNWAAFELNNALNVSKVEDAHGKQIPASRNQQDFTVRLSFEQPLQKGTPASVTFHYDGHLTGSEDSPVYGIKFAAIHDDTSFLLYPSRWFPIGGYSTDRYSADLNITVPSGYHVLASGLETTKQEGDKVVYSYQFSRPSFPGSIAVVRDQGTPVSSEGVTTTLYFKLAEKPMASAYGEEIGKIMTYFTGVYGLPPYANLAVVETENGAPNGFAAPGMIFLNPSAIGKDVSSKLLANQISRQWWHALLSPVNRDHLWLTNGFAAYSELLWAEHVNGAAHMETLYKDTMVEALTVDNVPIIQAARLEDYSPELWALTGAKGATVLNMLRYVIGDDKFFQAIKQYTQAYAWKSVSTEEFQKVVESVANQDLGYFFIEWIESSGAPEFKLDYTIYRTQKGFRVMGKVSQDLDTFRMPVELKIETEGNPETKRVDVVGTSSEFSVDTFGKPKTVTIDPEGRVLRMNNQVRVAVAIRRGEQFAEVSEFGEALKEYQKALEANRNSSLAHYRIAEVFFLQNNYQSAANEFRAALDGDLEPKWVEVWSHLKLGNIFDITGQRDRAVNEYQQAVRTKDNTQNAQGEAARYLKNPYERKSRLDG